MYHKILVPLDGSQLAESALRLASELARISNAEITLLRIVEYPLEIYSKCDANTLTYPDPSDEKLQVEKDTIWKEAETYLKLLASTIEMNLPKVSIEVQDCPVVNAILGTIEKSEIDLIVISTVGQGHNPWMIGAVANRLLRESPVPVILIGKESSASFLNRSHRQSAAPKNESIIQENALLN